MVIDLTLALPLVLGLFGACIGSFLNVVIYRLPQDGLSIARPRRSFCPKCKRSIPWSENLPVVSWLLLGGKCRGCKGEIAVRYLFVEVVTAFLFGLWGHLFLQRVGVSSFGADGAFTHAVTLEQWVVLLEGLALTAACIVVTFIDIDLRIIPDEITIPGVVIGFLLSVAAPVVQEPSWLFAKITEEWHLERHLVGGLSSAVGAGVGWLALWLVGVAGKAVFKPKEGGEATDAMGFGDVKLMAMVGAFLGADGVLLVFFVGCVTGSFGGLGNFLLGLPEVIADVARHARRHGSGGWYVLGVARRVGWRRRRFIPFGPFLSIGVVIIVFWRASIVHLLLHEWPELVHGWLGIHP